MRRVAVIFCVLAVLVSVLGCVASEGNITNDAAQPAPQKTVTVYFKVTISGCDLPVSNSDWVAGFRETVIYTKEEPAVSYPQPGVTYSVISEYWIMGDAFKPIYQKHMGLKISTTNKCGINIEPWMTTLVEE